MVKHRSAVCPVDLARSLNGAAAAAQESPTSGVAAQCYLVCSEIIGCSVNRRSTILYMLYVTYKLGQVRDKKGWQDSKK